MTLATFALVLLLASCSEAPSREGGEIPVIPTSGGLVTATIDGRSFKATGGTGAAEFVLDTSGSMFNVIGRRTRGDCKEILQLTLFGFQGVGAYSLAGWDGGVGLSGIAVYGCDGQAAHWSDSPLGRKDTAWVTVYDSISKHVEGKFRFLGVSGGDSVMVTAGSFKGTASEYQPGP